MAIWECQNERKNVDFACVYKLISNSLARLQEMAKGRLRLDLDSTLYTLYVLCYIVHQISVEQL
jgi:hypothetical protein